MMDIAPGSDGGLSPADFHPLSDLLHLFEEEFEFTFFSLFDLDSSNMQPEHWQMIARSIYERYNSFDGFLILHGTDTLSYTSAALSFMLDGLNKPVVLTGSQLPLRVPASDGHNNVINSLQLIKYHFGGVFIVFGNEVIRGTRAKKVSAFDLQAFTSVNDEPVGNIGLTIKWKNRPKIRHNTTLKLKDKLDQRVALLKIFPGFSEDFIYSCIKNDYKGIVLESFGVGNVPGAFRSLIPAIKKATSSSIPVVIVSQCMTGAADLSLYQVGKEASMAGAISGGDMLPETAVVKLMWALGNFKNINKIKKVMISNLKGEIGF